MKILTISGSARSDSTNTRLLKSLKYIMPELNFSHSDLPKTLPLFTSAINEGKILPIVSTWRAQLQESEGIIICIPEYIYNLPALIKNALEWITSSGELAGKKVLALTFTPNEPRGEKAMQSLLWSLQALDANILASLALYQTEISFISEKEIAGEGIEVLKEALKLFLQ